MRIVQPTATPPVPIKLGGVPVPLLDRARIYVCGITPYDVTHLGHAATYVWVDVLRSVLADSRITPEVCRNVTDVDDVLSAAAGRAETPDDTFAYLQQYHFDRDMAALRVARPSHEPRARHHVNQVIALASALLDSGAAYLSAGSVYLPGDGIADQAGLDAAGAVELATEYGGKLDDPAKRHPLDNAVWQAAAGDEQQWESPWGPGRPGWHASCTAMVLTTFGLGVDIHAGGADLHYPHHAYEAALGETLTGVRPYARSWFRVGVVHIDGAKMAKSAGNLVLISELLESYSPEVVRLMLIDRPWSQPWDFTPGLLDQAAARLDALAASAERSGSDAAISQVRAALRDDLDVPRAINLATESGGAAANVLMSLLRIDRSAAI